MLIRGRVRERFQRRWQIVGGSRALSRVLEVVERVAPVPRPVLILGERGTGKELVARAIHAASARAGRRFVVQNCSAFNDALLDSELFGHKRGAFTGAVSDRKGAFVEAIGGTLFLDEIGELPLTSQARLLRALEAKTVQPIGSDHQVPIDVRVVAATNRGLSDAVARQQFRADLYFRLNVFPISLPALRERRDDIPTLVRHFVQVCNRRLNKSIAEPDGLALRRLIDYPWPGNVRELENVIERACVTCRNNVIEPDNLPAEVVSPAAPKSPFQIDLNRPLPQLVKETIATLEKHYIQKALRKTHGHVGRCAKICGMSRRSITSKIAEYALDKSSFQEQ